MVCVAQGSRPMLQCPLRAVPASTDVRWLMGNRELGTTDGVEVRMGNGSWLLEVLSLATVDRDNGDKYVCEARDGDRLLRYEITLYITRKQQWYLFVANICCGSCWIVDYLDLHYHGPITT